jgi:hypothetical protein
VTGTDHATAKGVAHSGADPWSAPRTENRNLLDAELASLLSDALFIATAEGSGLTRSLARGDLLL